MGAGVRRRPAFLARLSFMPARPASKLAARSFSAVLERTANNLGWVIIRVPFNVAETWGKRGQLRVQGEINGFAFQSTLFPTRGGEHFLLVNKKMQSGGKTAAGLTAKFRLQPDLAPRPAPAASGELLRELSQSKRLLKFYESLSNSARRDIAQRIGEGKHEETRRRRAQQLAERLMETMEAERDLPPMIEMAFRQNPRARERWESMPASHRRRHLLAIFYYREPESRMRRLAKVIDEMLGRKPASGNEEDFSETI
jgi:uncharacterized protein DUF1905/bacteriocin resistance YdeI/OmpD-like protein